MQSRNKKEKKIEKFRLEIGNCVRLEHHVLNVTYPAHNFNEIKRTKIEVNNFNVRCRICIFLRIYRSLCQTHMYACKILTHSHKRPILDE